MKYKLISEIKEGYSPVQQVLTNRGIHSKDIEKYLKTTDEDTLDPELLNNIKKAALCLITHIKNNNKILVQIDSDCDGYTSSAVLINYLYKQFPIYSQNNIEIRLHEGKEHGIIVEEVLNKGYSLIIVPDAGSNQYEAHKTLKDAGIDVIVIDHHEAEKESEDAIIVNNQLSENYTNKTLSGVGVVYKFLTYLDNLMGTKDADSYLDLVALGMVADMMDMRNNETKHLIQKGLSNIENPFFKGLVERQSFSLGGCVTPTGVSFYISPLINATIRVGTQKEKEVMFKAMLNHLAYEKIDSTKRGCKGQKEFIVQQAIRNSMNIRNRQKKSRDEGIQYVEEIISTNKLDKNKIIVAEVNETLDKNLTGLVANQLMAKYQKPILLVRETEDGELQGSARGYDKSELKDLRNYLLSTGSVTYAEGHANAMGVGLKRDSLIPLIEKANTDLANIDFLACYDVDYIYAYNDFKQQDIVDIGSMKNLWGKGVEESCVAIKGVKVTKSNIVLCSADRNPTLKITLPNGVSMIKFGSSLEEYNNLLSDGYIEIDVVGVPDIDDWSGVVKGQIKVKEYEIVSKQEYYF